MTLTWSNQTILGYLRRLRQSRAGAALPAKEASKVMARQAGSTLGSWLVVAAVVALACALGTLAAWWSF